MKFSAHRAIISALALSLALAGAGRPQSVTTTYGYDQYGQLVSKTDTAGASTYYTYDPAGNRTQISPNPPQSNGPPVAGAVSYGGLSKSSGTTEAV
jgi:YD repeat-containing protein